VEPNTIEHDIVGARRLFDELADAGIDLDDVWETLEREGVQKFIDSFDELLEGIRSKRAELAPA
jgi:transaldolase